MSRYILNSSTFTKLDDPPGIVENISGFKAEIYYSPTATTGIILYPFQSMPYTVPLWACKEQGEEGTAVLATIPYNGVGSGSGTTTGGGTTYIDDDDDDDSCGCGCNVNINVTTNTHSGCGCGCCDTTSTTIAPVTLPGGDCGCGCGCHCGGSDTAVVTLPAEICDCQTISGGKKNNSCKNKGGIELNMPIVINIPNYVPVMPTCGCGNNKSSPSTIEEEDSTNNKSLIDDYFADKNIDGGTSGNLTGDINKYFAEKEI